MIQPQRRRFLKTSLAAGAAALGASLVPRPVSAARRWLDDGEKADKPLRLLVLGGTAFLGPEVVAAAQMRGHSITLFNRGKTRPELFPDLEKLRGDRDPDKDEGLKALEGREWDAVIDNSGYYPRMVGASARLLAPKVGHYVFVSSISAYAKNDVPGADEEAPVGTMADPTLEEMGAEFEHYGPLKALCEKAAAEAFPGRATIVRPGYIVGPGDWTGRFTWWPLRVEQGGEMIAPGSPEDPVQIIDVRDLAEWMVLAVERKVAGVFNACGPAAPLSMGTVLETSRKVTGSDAKLAWVPPEFLQEKEIAYPIWLPPTGETAGFHRWSNARAVKAGLKFRELEATVRDTLAWHHGLPQDRQERVLRQGPTREREAAVLAEWRERAKASEAKREG